MSYLNSFLAGIDPNEELFIIGDLNLNWLNDNGEPLRKFCFDNSLSNFVTEPTRCISETLIDVVLHNSNSIESTKVVEFPFSDHRIVFTNCYFKSIKWTPEIKLSRKINKDSIPKIFNSLSQIDFNCLKSIWLNIHNIKVY